MTSVSQDIRFGVNAGKALKVPCKAASTADLTLSGEQTVDGVALVADDRCLVKNQTDASENGVYRVSTGSWVRAPDWDDINDVTTGTLVSVISGGTSNGNTIWKVTTTGSITPGTTEVAFALGSLGSLGTTTDVVNHTASFTGSVARTVQTRFNEFLFLTDFDGIDNTGATDCSTGFQAALTAATGSTLYVPEGTYLIETGLTIPANTRMLGASFRGTIVKKGANITMLDMAGSSTLENIYLDGNSGSYTGKGCYITSGAGQSHKDVYIYDCQDDCLGFANEVGSGFMSINSHYYNGVRTISVQLPDDTGAGVAIPRYFIGMQLDGGAIHMGSCVDAFLNSCFMNDIQFDTTSNLVNMSNCRVASGTNTVTIKGLGHSVTGCSFSDDVEFDETCRGIYWANNSAASVTWAPNAATYCSIEHSNQSMTPSWTQDGGVTPPSIGDGTILIEYTRHAMTCECSLYFAYGTTTTPGDGNYWKIELPYPPSGTSNALQGGVALVQESGGSFYPMQWEVYGSGGAADSGFLILYDATGYAKAGNPVVWSAGDKIILNFTYHTDR